MKRKDSLQLFKFRFSKLSCICNFFPSLCITCTNNDLLKILHFMSYYHVHIFALETKQFFSLFLGAFKTYVALVLKSLFFKFI